MIKSGQSLVIASHNAGKVAEIGELLAPLGLRVLSATEANITEPEETGDTFAENAALKSVHAMESSGMASLADDSGLVVPGINGQPGIYSARWAGPKKDFAAAFARIEKELIAAQGASEGAPAYFICTLALSLPGGETHLFEGRIDGTLTFAPRGSKGFGYDPIFVPLNQSRTFAEYDAAEKNRVSHRAIAFEKFLQFLKEHA